jgi:hypothetical protein
MTKFVAAFAINRVLKTTYGKVTDCEAAPHRTLTCISLVAAHSRFGNTVRSKGEKGAAMLEAVMYML